MLLPYYARTLERIRAEDLDLSYRQMAEALGTTASAGALTRADGARVDHTTLRAIEMGRNWPRDPDAWAAAYGELIGLSGRQVWREAMREYQRQNARPENRTGAGRNFDSGCHETIGS